MTACVNKNHGRRVAGVVTASLVGALTLGGVSLAAVPTVALAEQAGLQFTAPGDAYTAGKVDNSRTTFNKADADVVTDGFQFNYEKNKPVVLDEVTVQLNKVSDEYTLFKFDNFGKTKDGKYQVKYYAQDEKGNPTGDAITSDVTAAGKYVAVVTATSGNYADGYCYVPFQIKGQDISSATLSKNTFTYDADPQKLTVNFGGKTLVEGYDYTVNYYKSGHDLTDAYKVDSITDAGEYTVVVNGTDSYSGSVTFKSVKVNKLDLYSDVKYETVVRSGDAEPTAPDAVWVDGVRYGSGSNLVKQLQAQNTRQDLSWGTADDQTFTYEVSPVKKDDPNFTQKGYVTVRKVASDAAWTYRGQAFPSTHEVIANDDSTHWDSTKVKATSPDGKTVYDVKKYVVDGAFLLDGDAEPSNWGTTPGKYTVVFVAKDSDGKVVGKNVVEITVYEQAVNADASAAVNYDADGLGNDAKFKVVSSISKTYDGKDLLAKVPAGQTDAGKGEFIRVTVEYDGNKLVEGRDFDVSYYKGDQRVPEIVNAGTYTLKLTSSRYKLSGTTEMTITVGKKVLSGVFADAETTKKFDKAGTKVNYVPWTESGWSIADLDLRYGEEKTGTVPGNPGSKVIVDYKLTDDVNFDSNKVNKEDGYWYVNAGKWTKVSLDHAGYAIVDGVLQEPGNNVALYEPVFKTIGGNGGYTYGYFENFPHEAFKVTLLKDGQAVEKLTDEGVYTIHFEARNDDAKNNYEVPGDLTVTVIKPSHLLFTDVTYGDYFADAVASVAGKGLMNGYSGTNVFGAQNSLKRGDVAVVLYNMAQKYESVEKFDETNSSYDKVHGYKSFDDVDGTMYYGAAIAWAKQAGVVSGHGGQFRPEDSVSREEFAAMLFNYAKKFGRDASFDADALSKVSDADSVSGWAKDAVSWAVSNKIMGNGGYVSGQSTIKRADTAGMVNNFTK